MYNIKMCFWFSRFGIRSLAVTFCIALLTLGRFSVVSGQTDISASAQAEPIVAEPFQQGFPYTKTFDITGYYSPVPGQARYATGSYESEIRLNGGGVHGASGKNVYPGMIAAPSPYPFGTKMYIPGIGTAAVYDRGGAIVSADTERGQKMHLQHDRLDIWMGYSDNGLERALAWGRRRLSVTVYGVDPSIQENVYLEGYSESEKYIRETFFAPKLFPADIWYLSSGSEVFQLQRVLKELAYLQQEPTGFYGDETRDAVFRFQQVQGLVNSFEDLGAGHSGPQTRQRLEKLFQENKSQTLPRSGLGLGSQGEDVKKLQRILKLLGYHVSENGVFDQFTTSLLLQFQKDQGILKHSTSYGAGFFGPKTREVIEKRYTAAVTDQEDAILIDVPDYLVQDLHFGDSGPAIFRLQEELQKFQFLRIESTGFYGPVTEHAVFKFQQSKNLVLDKKSKGAGEFGPVTRSKLNEILAARHHTKRLIASKKIEQSPLFARAPLIPEGLSFGSRGEAVERLQEFLKSIGFINEQEVTGYFGERTKEAVIAFQKTHHIISSEFETGAGKIGPQTKSFIEKIFSTKSHG